MKGDAIPAGDLVLRRFDPKNVSHWSSDDSGAPGRLRASALRWDPSPEAAPVRKECSVYQQSKVLALGRGIEVCLEQEGWEIAGADPAAIRAVDRRGNPGPNSPFDVTEDEYPSGIEGAHERDAAHAAVGHPLPLSGANKWYSKLAMTFRRVS